MTQTSTEATPVPTEDLRALLDLAVGSLNFPSGFLGSTETEMLRRVEMLRRIAVLLGVDPMVGTPSKFATQYPHAFREPEYLGENQEYFHARIRDRCYWCNQPEGRHPDQLVRRP